jgi:bisphosphoglycerate-independent phosphoglycerate mutase (AlkP superfamily)
MSFFICPLLSLLFLQVRVNLPNGDMVGHTGDIEATVVACKAADEAVKVRVITYVLLSTIFDGLLITHFL